MSEARSLHCPFRINGIHQFVSKYIRDLDSQAGRRVLDIPCGAGRATWEFKQKEAEIVALDLFPQFMGASQVTAQFADLTESLPLQSDDFDWVVCEEGIEHVPNQLAVLEEFNRVLKRGGRVLLTTPNDSHLRARLSRFLFETDIWNRMPPTEIDSVWFAEGRSDKLYLGHLFLLGVQQLQSLATFSGFRVTRRVRTEVSGTSAILAAVCYPILVLLTLVTYFSYVRKNSHVDERVRKEVLWERVKLNLSPKTLCCKHIFWELTKVEDLAETRSRLKALTRHAA